MKRIALFGVIVISILCAACSSWERQTYQTLAAARAVINQAVRGYQSGAIPRTPAAYGVIHRARLADEAAVQAFETYAELRLGSQNSNQIAAAQAMVKTLMRQLPAIMAPLDLLLRPAASPHKTTS